MKESSFPSLFARSLAETYAKWREGGGGDFVRKDELIRAYAAYLLECGESVSHEKIKDMLSATKRGYVLNSSEISLALRGGPFGRWRGMEAARKSNGRRVVVDGRKYLSIRDAAKGQGTAPETVRNRVASSADRWIGWCYDD